MKKILRALRNIYLTRTPMYVFFFVTSLCNAKCKMCFNWSRIDRAGRDKDLSLEEVKKIFSTFSNIQQLTISGGEPFLRDDLAQILGFISQKNDVQMITIPTNGILTGRIAQQTGDILNRIKKDTHLRIALSIEGIGKKHDEIVQVEGAFKNVEETYRRLKPLINTHKNFNVDISICCSAFNKGDLKELFRYCSEHFGESSIELAFARGDTRDKNAKAVTYDEYREILDYLGGLKNAKKKNKPLSKLVDTLTRIVGRQVNEILQTKKMPARCYAYSKLIVLQNNGDVLPCEYLDKGLGNLKDYGYDISRVLKDKKNKEIEFFIKKGGCFCTWECALMNNIACNPKTYPAVLKELISPSIAPSPKAQGAVK